MVSQLGHALVISHQGLRPIAQRHQIRNRKAPSLEGLQHTLVGGESGATCIGRRDLTQAVGKKAQRPCGGDARVQLANRSCCGIARVDKGFFAFGSMRYFFALSLVQGLKVVTAHIHLAAYLQHMGHVGVLNTQWDLAYRANIGGHVLA